MGPKCPPNLTHSTAYLKDNPYEVQLGVLKYVRGLVFEVVEASTTAALASEGGTQGNGGDDECSRPGGDSLLLETEEEEEEEEWARKLDGQKGECEGVILDTSGHEEGSDGSTAVARGGRKRPRTATLHGQDCFGTGSVVECFHAVSDPHTRQEHLLSTSIAVYLRHCFRSLRAVLRSLANTTYSSSTVEYWVGLYLVHALHATLRLKDICPPPPRLSTFATLRPSRTCITAG